MKQEHAELLELIKLQISLHQQLTLLGQEKIRLILNQDWEALEEQIEKSRCLLHKIETAERQRLEIVRKISGSHEMLLSEIVEKLPPELAQDLLKNGNTLRGLILDLKNLNSRCERLIESSMEVVDFTLSLFTGTGPGGKTYGGDGEERLEKNGHTSLVFDVKA
jgi:hypothetical protein